MPVIWNDLAATPALTTRLLFDIKRAQSAGVQHMVNAFRSPRGDLPVVGFCEDTFYIKCSSSLDPMVQVKRPCLCMCECSHVCFLRASPTQAARDTATALRVRMDEWMGRLID
jgi:hypothetical protein